MRQLSEIDDNFTNAWTAYRPNASYYAMLTLVTALIAFGLFLLIFGVLAIASIPSIIALFNWFQDVINDKTTQVPAMAHFIWIGTALVLLMIANGFIRSWQNAAIWMAFSAPTRMKISHILKQAVALTPRYFGLGLLSSLIVGAGTMLFIVPGILFSGWFTFSGIAAQKKTIMESLKYSRSLVMNRWWAIIIRLALGSIIAIMIPQILSSVISGILSSGSQEYNIGTALGILVSLAFGIFQVFFLTQWYTAYKYVVYLNAVESLETTPSELPAAPQVQ
jgi:hypothetical protein